ncbi:MAG: PD-(D/E)XK nuclease family protein [Bacteroidales bacterium]|nr:PD-(D/E)XK nuclease family protein [Bacteroidales bacterium]
MVYFLERIAKLLCSENGNNLRSHCLVFPNRRAGLYFRKYLAAEISKPVWIPSVTTINDLFRSLSDLQPAENEMLLFELYGIYRRLSKSPESFDDFYFWGEMLLNDFDDVDKYLVNSSLLFRNVKDLREIDRLFGELTQEQCEIIRRFWVNFNPEKLTGEKSEFIRIWSILNDLYNEFREALKIKSLGYEGMLFRDVIENRDPEELRGIKWDKVHFIGFNALNECEKELMLRLRRAGRARFYWDYDNSYMGRDKLNSAGYFLKENIKLFGNDMPGDWSYDTLLSKDYSSAVRRRVIDTSSDVAQVKLIPLLVKELTDLTPETAHHTAVILADENLLIPVLTSLPESVKEVNVTMGYPLKQSLVYSLVRRLLDLQHNSVVRNGRVLFRYTDVSGILKDPFISGLLNDSESGINKEIISANLIWVPSAVFEKTEHLAGIFKKPADPAMLSDYIREILLLIVTKAGKDNDPENKPVQKNITNEFIYRVMLSLNRLDAIAGSTDITFTTDTWARILDGMLRSQAVPFSGEPLSGIQVMGILETRTLDFRNLIILSVNEGVLPSASAGSSFIPFSIREAFRLPSINHQESIYAYHFYRLLHRAENVTFVYNSNPEGLRSGEMSRFLQQIKYEPSQEIRYQNLGFEIKTHSKLGVVIERTGNHMEQLFSSFSDGNNSGTLSPSAVNTWLHCRMKFYYRYVNRLREPDRITPDIDPSMLGTLLHDIMKRITEKYSGKEIDAGTIDGVICSHSNLNAVIRNTINDYFKRSDNNFTTGNELIVTEVLMAYLKRILNIDRSYAPLTILEVEKFCSFRMALKMPYQKVKEISVGGRIDRVDMKDGVIRIVDYKTGTVSDSISSVSLLFDDDRKKDPDGWLQTLLYCEAYLAGNPGKTVRPSIYKIKKLPADGADDMLRVKASRNNEFIVEDYISVRQEFMEGLSETVNTIFSSDEPFVMTTDRWNKCAWCPYNILCMR